MFVFHKVHNQTDMPFPEDDGSFVMPGTATRISVDKKSHHRLGVVDHKVYQAYYSDCIDSLMLDREETERLDAYTSSRLDVAYSRRGCLNTCYQRKLMQTCKVIFFISHPLSPKFLSFFKCFDFFFPNTGKAFEDLPVVTDACSYSNVEQWDCKESIEQERIDGTLECDCPDTCRTDRFDTSISMLRWPNAHSGNLVCLQ